MNTMEEASWDAVITAITFPETALGLSAIVKFAHTDSIYQVRHQKGQNEFLDDHTENNYLWVVDSESLQKFLNGRTVEVQWKRRKRGLGHEQPFINLHDTMAAIHFHEVVSRVLQLILSKGRAHIPTVAEKKSILEEAKLKTIDKHIEWNMHAIQDGGWLGMMRVSAYFYGRRAMRIAV